MSETERPAWFEAFSVAARAHADHLRKDGRTPYFAHPARVALTLSVVFGCRDETILAAAALHDTIEDTRVDYDDLLGRFGRDVADIVATLSKDMRLEEAEREADYDRRLAAGPVGARLVKLADVYDNLLSARDEPARLRRSMARVRRAVAIAGKDPMLDDARALVEALADRMEAAS